MAESLISASVHVTVITVCCAGVLDHSDVHGSEHEVVGTSGWHIAKIVPYTLKTIPTDSEYLYL